MGEGKVIYILKPHFLGILTCILYASSELPNVKAQAGDFWCTH